MTKEDNAIELILTINLADAKRHASFSSGKYRILNKKPLIDNSKTIIKILFINAIKPLSQFFQLFCCEMFTVCKSD